MTTDRSFAEQQCAKEKDVKTLHKLFDLRQDCSEFGPECECKRKIAKEKASKYFKLQSRLKNLDMHMDSTNSRMVSKKNPSSNRFNPKSYTKLSERIDSFPADESTIGSLALESPYGKDTYLDYTNGQIVTSKPDHPYYKKTAAIEIRDPTCKELKAVLRKQCDAEQANGDENYDKKNRYTVGQVCGMGTTWHPKLQTCMKVPKEISEYDGTGQPFEESPYPALRPSNYSTPFDDPTRLTVNVDIKVAGAGYRQFSSLTDSCGCGKDRCRYPLTSAEGRNQASIFVRLFREINEYRYCPTTSSQQKNSPDPLCNLMYRLKRMTDTHTESFSYGIHSSSGSGLLFLPWHRWFLLEVETILLEWQEEINPFIINCNDRFLGIPYFDWHNLKPGESPKMFVNNAHDRYGHHLHDSLGQDTDPGYRIGPIRAGELAYIRRVQSVDYVLRRWRNGQASSTLRLWFHPRFLYPHQFMQFSRGIEDAHWQYFTHNYVHNIVGGDMDSGLAANDPIFHVHHANVDKIWNDWQKQSEEHRNAFVPSVDKTRSMGAESRATVQDMLNLNELRYTSSIDPTITTSISVEYVDMDTSNDWGRENTSSINLEEQEWRRWEI